MKKVSILVPMYGVERYIVQCARSILSQSYPACEFIFVDDKSKDSSLTLLKGVAAEFPHLLSQIKIIELEINGGVAAARNAALDAASGDFVLFVDADDWVDKNIVEELIIRTVECDAQICNAWCESVGPGNKSRHTPAPWIGSNRNHLRAVLGQSHIVPNHVRGMLISRELFKNGAVRFTPGVNFGEDYSLLPQLIHSATRLASLPKYLYFYRIENEGSYMNNIGARHIEEYVAAQRIVSDFIESLPEAAHYKKALEKGRVNIKKWIFKRGANPKEFNKKLFGEAKPTISSPLLKLYNFAIDRGNILAVKTLSIVVNLPLYLQNLINTIRPN